MTTIEDLHGEVARMARGLARKWPGIDPEDIEQEMMLTLAERWGSVAHSAHLALGLAHKRGQQYCSQERTEYQMNSAQWIYTPGEVRSLLPSLFDALAWEDAPKRPSRGKEYLQADGISVLMMDMRSAFEAISEQHQATILSVFRHGTAPKGSTEGMRVTRAVDAMTAVLNREVYRREDDHDGPGARTAISNAAAQFQTSNDY